VLEASEHQYSACRIRKLLDQLQLSGFGVAVDSRLGNRDMDGIRLPPVNDIFRAPFSVI
jgi:hypothetical protein